MKQFRDKTGRSWAVELTIGAVKRVKQLLDVDLLAPEAGDPPLSTRMQLDIVLLVDVLFAIIKPQADAAGVSDVEFGESLEGDAVAAAFDATMEEWADFFRRCHRTAQASVITRGLELVRRQMKAAEEAVGRLMAKSEQAVDRQRESLIAKAEAEIDGNGLMSGS